MDAADRQRALHRFRTGQVDVLTNCNVLTEGFDEPRVDCVLMARPTHSQLLYSQMVGRGTRLCPGKTDVIVLDVVDNSDRHHLAGLDRMFDLPEGLDLDGRNALEVAAEIERVSRTLPWIDLDRVKHAGELEVIAERIDLFRFEPPPEIGDFTHLAWCRNPDGGYRLSMLDGEWVSIREDNLGRWKIDAHVTRPTTRSKLPDTVLALPEAVILVDAMISKTRPEASRVLGVDASWRSQVPTAKQLEALTRRHIPYPAGLTRGQASWMIAHSAMRNAERHDS